MREHLGLLSDTCLQISPVSSERDHPYLFFKTAQFVQQPFTSFERSGHLKVTTSELQTNEMN